jgi:signal transduction histidine kinase
MENPNMGAHATQELETPIMQSGQKQADKPILLIVDDEAGPRESLRIVFKDRYHCVLASCGREGIDCARQHPVDAAILDIRMPDLSGVEVLRELKKVDPDVEVIMLTGYETVDTARAALRLGAADYLNKPFDVFSVRELIEQCLTRRQHKLAAKQSIADLHRVNEELSRELAQSNRAVEAGLLSSGVVHEINNPLTIITGYAEMLQRDLATLQSSDPKTAEHMQHRLAAISREIDRCKEIAQRFLNFARANHKKAEVIEAAKLVEDAASLLKAHPSRGNVEIVWSSSETGLQVHVHPTEILQVLINLGVNALHAMDGKGVLKFIAERATNVPTTCAFRSDHFDAQHPSVKLSVADTGCGIAPDDLRKVFQSYYTTKKEGAGLGLAIVRELVIGSCGGAIDVQSVVGQGSTFCVYLPLAK